VSGSTYEVIDGVRVSFSDDIELHHAYYPVPAWDGQPWVGLPHGTDPGPAVARVKAKLISDLSIDMTFKLKEAAPADRAPMFFKLVAGLDSNSIENIRTALVTRFPELAV